MPTREQVYDAIDSERDYQAALESDSGRCCGRTKTVGDYGLLLHRYMAQLDIAFSDNAGDDQALNVIRKIAGIAVHCMEDCGAPHREMPEKYKPEERQPSPENRMRAQVIPASDGKPCELILSGEIWGDSHFWVVMNGALLAIHDSYENPADAATAPLIISTDDSGWCHPTGAEAFESLIKKHLMNNPLFYREGHLGIVMAYSSHGHTMSKYAGGYAPEELNWEPSK